MARRRDPPLPSVHGERARLRLGGRRGSVDRGSQRLAGCAQSDRATEHEEAALERVTSGLPHHSPSPLTLLRTLSEKGLFVQGCSPPTRTRNLGHRCRWGCRVRATTTKTTDTVGCLVDVRLPRALACAD